MKKNLMFILSVIALVLCIVVPASASEAENNADGHVCVYDREVAKEEYLASPATCKIPAKYYKSCVCGSADKETTFSYGTSSSEHNYRAESGRFDGEENPPSVRYVCSECRAIDPEKIPDTSMNPLIAGIAVAVLLLASLIALVIPKMKRKPKWSATNKYVMRYRQNNKLI